MEHIDLSKLSDKQLQLHADRAQNDHFLCGKQENRQGMVNALAERNHAALRNSNTAVDAVDRAHRTLAFFQAQAGFWNSQAAALIDQSEGAVA